MRMFVAVAPPVDVVASLERFLDPRRDAAVDEGFWRFSPATNYHLTLAFLGDVRDDHLDRLVEGLAGVGERHAPLQLRLDGAGCFGNPGATKHLYQAVAGDTEELGALATNVRNASQHAGCNPDGQAFRAHLTVARTSRPTDATKWLRVLDTYRSPDWLADGFTLYASHLGEGPNGSPRYQAWEEFAFGADAGARP